MSTCFLSRVSCPLSCRYVHCLMFTCPHVSCPVSHVHSHVDMSTISCLHVHSHVDICTACLTSTTLMSTCPLSRVDMSHVSCRHVPCLVSTCSPSRVDMSPVSCRHVPCLMSKCPLPRVEMSPVSCRHVPCLVSTCPLSRVDMFTVSRTAPFLSELPEHCLHFLVHLKKASTFASSWHCLFTIVPIRRVFQTSLSSSCTLVGRAAFK